MSGELTMPSGRALRTARSLVAFEIATQAHVELAPHEHEKAVDLCLRRPEALGEQAPRLIEDLSACGREPPGHRRAMDAVDGADGVDVEAVDVMEAEHVALV